MTKGKLLKTIGTVASWFFAVFLLLIGFGAFIGSDPTSGILLLVMGGILLPPLARFVNYRHFGKVKAAIFVICFILFSALSQPPPNQVQPIASPSPSPSKQAPPTSSPSPKPSPSPRPKAQVPSLSPTPKPKPVAPPPSPVEKAVEPSPSSPPAPAVIESPQSNCDSSYPDVCIPPPPPDLNCPDITYRNFTVQQPDPHGFDRDSDGIGCEKN